MRPRVFWKILPSPTLSKARAATQGARRNNAGRPRGRMLRPFPAAKTSDGDGLGFGGRFARPLHTTARIRDSNPGDRMTILIFTILVCLGSLLAGLLGALTGLGGGVVLVPLLTLFFHVDIRYAIGASLVSVIATSSGAAAAYVKEGFSNIRIGMFL